MASVVLTERFVSDASGIWSDKALDRIRRCVLPLEAFPEMGLRATRRAAALRRATTPVGDGRAAQPMAR